MRKVIFTAILLLVLGTAWTLYLEYDNRRFIEVLPQPPSATKRTDDTPIDRTESSPGPSIEVENTQTVPSAEGEAEVAPTPHESAEALTVEELRVDVHSETTAPPHTENSDAFADPRESDDMTEENSQGLTQAEKEKRERALAVLNRMMKTSPEVQALLTPEALMKLGDDKDKVLDALGISKGQVKIVAGSAGQLDELLNALDTLNNE